MRNTKQKFEYKIYSGEPSQLEYRLNQEAKDGWRCVSVCDSADYPRRDNDVMVVFERPVEHDPDHQG